VGLDNSKIVQPSRYSLSIKRCFPFFFVLYIVLRSATPFCSQSFRIQRIKRIQKRLRTECLFFPPALCNFLLKHRCYVKSTLTPQQESVLLKQGKFLFFEVSRGNWQQNALC
jgi:hypothetical protein